MATIAAPCTPSLTGAVVSIGTKPQRSKSKVVHITGLNSFGGLKAHNSVGSLGMPACPEMCFAKVVSSLKKGRGGGGALSSKCSKVDEIFQIAAIVNGLVLIGVAVGFVLLRIEASVEESE